MTRVDPYLRRLGLTSGQASTLSLGLVLGGVLIATSVPPVWQRATATGPAAGSAQVPAAPQSVAPPTPDVVLPAATQEPAPAEATPPAPAPAPPAPEPSAADPAPEPSPPGTPVRATTAPEGLQVSDSGYSTTSTGPAATAGIPDGALPVGARAGSPVETSYVRLQGSGSRVLFAVSGASGASFGPGTPALRACRVRTADWRPARPGPAVPYDEQACVAGVLGADGRYSFDLSRFASRDDRRGFALSATPAGSTQTYRVSLIPLRSTT